MLTETSLGRPMDDALVEMADRVGSEDLEFVITAVTIQRQVGGSLAGIFDLVADTIRQRQQFARKIRSSPRWDGCPRTSLVGAAVLHRRRAHADEPGVHGPALHTPTGHMLIVIGLLMMGFGSSSSRKSSPLGADHMAAALSRDPVARRRRLPGRRSRHASVAPAAHVAAAVQRDYGRRRRVAGEQARFHDRVLVPRRCSGSRRLAVPAQSARHGRDARAHGCSPPASAGASPRQTFLAAKGALAVGGASFGLVVGGDRRRSGRLRVRPLLRQRAGFMIPSFLVTMRTKRRREELRAQLPDALDLLAVSVEAGLGFDGAITKLTEHMEGALTEELPLTLERDADRREPPRARSRSSPSARPRPRWRASRARSSRPTSSASRSAGSCASRRRTRASGGRPPPRSAR